MTAIARNTWSTTRRRWSSWRARTRRRRAALALAPLVLLVALGEPLMCIIHCDFWLPRAFGHYLAGDQHHQHQHHHTGAAPATGYAARPPNTTTVAQAPACGVHGCFSHIGHGAGSEAPFHVPPSPIHELLPMTLIVLAVALAVTSRLVTPTSSPPSVFIAPILRPPIPSSLGSA
jgi:hypothetical protein